MTPTPPRKRGRRFERPAEAPPFHRTRRDETIIRAIGHHRFLTSRHIQRLVGGSEKNVLERLKLLWQARYIDRPRAQLIYYSTTGTTPMLYALADQGAKLLNELDGLNFPEDDWAQKNRNVGRPYIEHSLTIADLHVALVVAVRTRSGVELIPERDLISAFPQPPSSRDRAFAWQTKILQNGVTYPVTINPDYSFALRSPTISRRCYISECDRGTMPIKRNLRSGDFDLEKTSIARKFLAYIQAFNDNMHERQFGWKAFRILFVTNTQQRADNMRKALQDLTTARNIRRIFYFATSDALATDVLAHQWIDGNGDPQLLI
jgi:hypothetical protein